MTTTALPIKCGNTKGRHFTQWRFDFLIECLNTVHLGPSPGRSQVLDIQDVEMWYDEQQDFHMLRFRVDPFGIVTMRFYIVLTTMINDKEFWSACPRHMRHEMLMSLRKELGVVVPPNPPE
jgi:hypothetical protein